MIASALTLRLADSTVDMAPAGERHEETQQQARVLIADDDPQVRHVLDVALRTSGYEVVAATDGYELVHLAQERVPDLILVDLMMPQMDGYEAIRQMRNDTRIAHVPMLILSARTRPADLVIGFEAGADDYISKPFNVDEVLVRVKSHLRRASRRPALNPLTGLPGGVLLAEELRYRLAAAQPFALLHIDLDHFKAFNDTYGFARGDQAILLVAHILRSVQVLHGNNDDFIGHIGGDDFAMLTAPERVHDVCKTIIAMFDREVRRLYHADDWQRGYLSGSDRYGILRRFGLMTISIGGVTSEHRTFNSDDEVTQVAAEMKHYAKSKGASSYAIDQRAGKALAPTERRNPRRQEVLLLSADASLCAVLRPALQNDGYTVCEARSVDQMRLRTAGEQPMLILADAQLGESLWQFCATSAANPEAPPIVVLAYTGDEVARARAVGVTYLQQPLPLIDVLACVDRMICEP